MGVRNKLKARGGDAPSTTDAGLDEGVLTNDQIGALVSWLVKEHGPGRAARMLGIARDTTLSVVANVPVNPGTYALLRERIPSLLVLLRERVANPAALSSMPRFEARR